MIVSGLALALGLTAVSAAPALAALPDRPTIVSAVASGPGSATVTWTAPANNGGSPITEYKIAVQPGTASAFVPASATSGTISGLANGTYTFTVKARNAEGWSLPSDASQPVEITGGANITAPDAPTGVTAVGGDSSATVSWTAPLNDGGSALTGYRVNVNPGQGVSMNVGPGETTMVFTGLTNGIEYTFTVQASNVVGRSVNSAPSNPVIPGGALATAPAAPTNVSATASGNQATIRWQPPASNGGAPVTEYRISVQPGTATAFVTAPSTTASLTLPAGTYTFTVRASNAAGASPASAPSNAVPISASTVRTKDFSGDGKGDVLARKSNGELWLHRGSGTGGFGAYSRIGAGWQMFDRILSTGDFSGDGRSDVIARKPDGELWLYRGNGTGGFGAYSRIGLGWQVFDQVFSTGDFSGDGRTDILARKPNGDLWLYRGNGAGGFSGYARIGLGWQMFDRVLSTGDFSGDGRTDVIGRKPNGELWLYRGNGTGGFSGYARIGTGWQMFDNVFGVGV